MDKKAMRSYQDLIAYQKAYPFSLNRYKCTKSFPKSDFDTLYVAHEEVPRLLWKLAASWRKQD